MRIKIQENGPYIVIGGIPIKEMTITPKGHGYELIEGRKLPQAESYALCRCGSTKSAPFCDGSHEAVNFNGTETASKAKYNDRVQEMFPGTNMTLKDDGRCAFARFCHNDRGNVWDETLEDEDVDNREAALKSARECPSGRLVMVDKGGKEIEEEYEPEIIILQDPEKSVSAGIYVKGPIVIESADGAEYEVRNRVALCRCGNSRNKPFCDASHVSVQFVDR